MVLALAAPPAQHFIKQLSANAVCIYSACIFLALVALKVAVGVGLVLYASSERAHDAELLVRSPVPAPPIAVPDRGKTPRLAQHRTRAIGDELSDRVVQQRGDSDPCPASPPAGGAATDDESPSASPTALHVAAAGEEDACDAADPAAAQQQHAILAARLESINNGNITRRYFGSFTSAN